LKPFKSLEYLRQHVLEALDEVTQILAQRYRMDIPYALEAARPLISSLVAPLYQQLDPHEFGASRRYLALGEEYSKIVMRRYSYPHLPQARIEAIVRRLVWDFPSHGFVLDLELVQELGLNAFPLEQETVDLCEQLTNSIVSCMGMAPRLATPTRRPRRRREGVAPSDGAAIIQTEAGTETREEGIVSDGETATAASQSTTTPEPTTVLRGNGSQEVS